MLKFLALLGVLAASVPTLAQAQAKDRKYVIGIRSGLINGTMALSGIDPAFDNLDPDGAKGPHMSGYFFLVDMRPHLRLGVETLVANSNKDLRTSMNYQAAGPVVELSWGRSWFVGGGVHVGGLIVNAMSRQGAAPATGAVTGSFYKGEGFFASPSADLGYRFGRTEVGLYVKRVNIFGEKNRGGMSDFSSAFTGLRLAFHL
jgi:hypothetical protein